MSQYAVHMSNTSTEVGKSSTEERKRFMNLLESLATIVIDNNIPTGKKCGECHGDIVKAIDEALLQIPIQPNGTLVPQYLRYIALYDERQRALSSHRENGFKYFNFPRTTYEMRMFICRSGIFSNKQLAGARFTDHELEVNSKQFWAIRPDTCFCRYYGTLDDFEFASDEEEDCIVPGPGFGTSLIFGKSLITGGKSRDPRDVHSAEAEAFQKEWETYKRSVCTPRHTQVEHEFVRGSGIRTGHRKRSEASRMRRKGGKPPVLVPVTGIVPVGPDKGKRFVTKLPEKALKIMREISAKAVRKYPRGTIRATIKHRFYQRLDRRRKEVHIIRTRPPLKHHTKYWYFLRTRSYYTYSIHHPYGDEI